MIMEELSAIKYEIKKSRFFSYLYSIDSEDEIAGINRIHREIYRKAAHYCYAARLMTGNPPVVDFGNDGEVGNPGRILLRILEQNDLDSHCIIVSRIFGGVKLGPAGVSRAFREAGLAAVSMYKYCGDGE